MTSSTTKAVLSGITPSPTQETKDAPSVEIFLQLDLGSVSHHDDPLSVEMMRSFIERVGYHSVTSTKGIFNTFEEQKRLQDKERESFLSKNGLRFKNEAVEMFYREILKEDKWNELGNASARLTVIENEFENLKNCYAREKDKIGHDVLAQINYEKLASYLNSMKDQLLNIFKAWLEDYDTAIKGWTAMATKKQDCIVVRESKLLPIEIQKLAEYKQKVQTPGRWKAQLSHEFNFKDLTYSQRVEFFRSVEQVTYKDKYENTRLHFCAWFDDRALASDLINLDRSIKKEKNKKNARGYAPFHFVIRKGSKETTKDFLTLLEPSCSDLANKDPQHMTALESAAFYGNKEALEWMITNHSKLFNKDSLKSAFDFACRKEKNDEAIHYLRSIWAAKGLLDRELQPRIFKAAIKGKTDSAVAIMESSFSRLLDEKDDLSELSLKELGSAINCLSDFEMRLNARNR